MKELLTSAVPLFKASKFFLNPEMSTADCAMAPIIWRLQSLDVPLPKDGKSIEDYGNRIFRHPGFIRSLTDQKEAARPAGLTGGSLHRRFTPGTCMLTAARVGAYTCHISAAPHND